MEITRYYSKVFKLPKATIMIVSLCVEFIFFLMLEKVVYHLGNRDLLARACLLISPVFSAFLVLLVFYGEKVFNIARLSFLGILAMGITGVTDLVKGSISTLYPLIPSIYLQLLVLSMIGGKLDLRSFFTSYSQLMLVATCFYLIMGRLSLSTISLILIIPMLAFIISLDVLIRVGTITDGGVNVLNLSRAFCRMWLASDIEEFERIIEKYSSIKEIAIHYIKAINNDELVGVIIVPEFHYGPFRNVGSSEAPALLSEKVGKEIGCDKVVVLHGAVTHKEDLASSRELYFIAEKVARELRRRRKDREKHAIIDVPCIIGEKFRIKALRIGKGLLLLVAPNRGGIEDVPYHYWNLLKKYTSIINIENAILVDEHNSILDYEKISYEELKELIPMAVEKIKKGTEEEVLMSVMTKKINLSKESGIGEAGIGIIYLKGVISKRSLMLIIIDGNNMINEFRYELIRRIKERIDVDEVEVLTTDTHSVSGLRPGGRGYLAIGESKDHERLFDIIIDVAIEAVSSARKVEFENGRIITKARMYGDVLDMLYEILEKGYKIFVKKVFPSILILLMCTSVLLSGII